jgi:dihydrodipicolinate synthase/N-acetylneuraminate lyase
MKISSKLPLRPARSLAGLRLRENVVPTVTPFKPGASGIGIDRQGVSSILHHIYWLGARAVLVNGATGEFDHLSNAQRREAVRSFSEEAASFSGERGFKIFANATGDSAEETGENVRFICGLENIAAVVIAPFYYLRTGNELLPHVRGIAGAIEGALPLLLYNVPGKHCSEHRGGSIPPAAVRDLASLIAGIKDSSGEAYPIWFYSMVTEVGQGDEGNIMGALSSGATFAVASIGNVVSWPQDMFSAGSPPQMRWLQKRIIGLRGPLTADLDKIPGALKYCLFLLGICNETVANDRNVLGGEERRAIEEILPEIVQSYAVGERAGL